MDFKQRLSKAVDERGVLAEIARITGISHVGISKIARGETKNPGHFTVRKIEAALDQLEAAAEAAP